MPIANIQKIQKKYREEIKFPEPREHLDVYHVGSSLCICTDSSIRPHRETDAAMLAAWHLLVPVNAHTDRFLYDQIQTYMTALKNVKSPVLSHASWTQSLGPFRVVVKRTPSR